jgi:hypothetical protein
MDTPEKHLKNAVRRHGPELAGEIAADLVEVVVAIPGVGKVAGKVVGKAVEYTFKLGGATLGGHAPRPMAPPPMFVAPARPLSDLPARFAHYFGVSWLDPGTAKAVVSPDGRLKVASLLLIGQVNYLPREPSDGEVVPTHWVCDGFSYCGSFSPLFSPYGSYYYRLFVDSSAGIMVLEPDTQAMKL